MFAQLMGIPVFCSDEGTTFFDDRFFVMLLFSFTSDGYRPTKLSSKISSLQECPTYVTAFAKNAMVRFVQCLEYGVTLMRDHSDFTYE